MEPELTNDEIADAWRELKDEFTRELARAQGAQVALQGELYLSRDDREMKQLDAEHLVQRLGNDLIALGLVKSRAEAKRMVTTP